MKNGDVQTLEALLHFFKPGEHTEQGYRKHFVPLYIVTLYIDWG